MNFFEELNFTSVNKPCVLIFIHPEEIPHGNNTKCCLRRDKALGCQAYPEFFAQKIRSRILNFAISTIIRCKFGKKLRFLNEFGRLSDEANLEMAMLARWAKTHFDAPIPAWALIRNRVFGYCPEV